MGTESHIGMKMADLRWSINDKITTKVHQIMRKGERLIITVKL